MTAKEAKELTAKANINIEGKDRFRILDSIKAAAEKGHHAVYLERWYLETHDFTWLEDLGYTAIKESIYPDGDVVTVEISWKE